MNLRVDERDLLSTPILLLQEKLEFFMVWQKTVILFLALCLNINRVFFMYRAAGLVITRQELHSYLA